MKTITADILVSAGACFHQVDRFQHSYPKGIEVCWECFKEAKQNHFLPVEWLVNLLYPHEGNSLAVRRKRRACIIPFLRYPYCMPSYITDEGLQALERKLLRCAAPKPNKTRIAQYKIWKRQVNPRWRESPNE